MSKFTVSKVTHGGILGIKGHYDVEIVDGFKRYTVFVSASGYTTAQVIYPMEYRRYGHRGTAYARRDIHPGPTLDQLTKRTPSC